MKTAIELAREAGLHIATDVNWMPIIGLEYAEKFAALARAAEREACAELAFEMLVKVEGTDFDVPDAIRARGNT